MHRYMNINAFGTDNFLRHTIRKRMEKLGEDDRVKISHVHRQRATHDVMQVIEFEGIDSLQDAEISQACQSRGIRTSSIPIERQREQLAQWIDLHINRELSGTLLILSKAFSIDAQQDGNGQLTSLKDTLSSLPDSLVCAVRFFMPIICSHRVLAE